MFCLVKSLEFFFFIILSGCEDHFNRRGIFLTRDKSSFKNTPVVLQENRDSQGIHQRGKHDPYFSTVLLTDSQKTVRRETKQIAFQPSHHLTRAPAVVLLRQAISVSVSTKILLKSADRGSRGKGQEGSQINRTL